MGGYFDISEIEKEINNINLQIHTDDFWQDTNKANQITKKYANLSKIFKEYKDLANDITELNEIQNLFESAKEKEEYISDVIKRIDALEKTTFLNGEFDNLNVYLEVHPGAGGTESCDWAEMLLRMYERFSEINNLKYEEINISKGDEAGIKNAIIKISGENIYGYLKNEVGVHRLIRISPFDANKRRHTSFASITITPEFINDINAEIKEEDLKIDVYHSSGAGGQSVNTSNSAVRITHLPTKIVVTCQNERSQLKNKEQALKILKNKIYKLEVEKKENILKNIKNDDMSINFGNQIRSYFLEPYKIVKDHRTNYENSDPLKILDGNLNEMLDYNLKKLSTIKKG